MAMMFVNLPVTDLERAKTFYAALGFEINPKFTDDNAACVVVDDDHNFFMLLKQEFFQTFTERPIAEAWGPVAVATALMFPSRDEVDSVSAAGLAAGGTEAKDAADYGFMYQRQITDPDGNVLEFGWMDPAAAEQGPDAYMAEQA